MSSLLSIRHKFTVVDKDQLEDFKSRRRIIAEKNVNSHKNKIPYGGRTGLKLALHRFGARIACSFKAIYGLNEDDAGEMLVRQKNACNGCGDPLTILTCSIDHVIPLCAGGKTNKNNFQLLCTPCNKAKGQMSMRAFITHARKIVEAHR